MQSGLDRIPRRYLLETKQQATLARALRLLDLLLRLRINRERSLALASLDGSIQRASKVVRVERGDCHCAQLRRFERQCGHCGSHPPCLRLCRIAIELIANTRAHRTHRAAHRAHRTPPTPSPLDRPQTCLLASCELQKITNKPVSQKFEDWEKGLFVIVCNYFPFRAPKGRSQSGVVASFIYIIYI